MSIDKKIIEKISTIPIFIKDDVRDLKIYIKEIHIATKEGVFFDNEDAIVEVDALEVDIVVDGYWKSRYKHMNPLHSYRIKTLVDDIKKDWSITDKIEKFLLLFNLDCYICIRDVFIVKPPRMIKKWEKKN